MRVEGKALAIIDEGTTDEDIYGPNGGFTAVLSTPSLDRDGDRLEREEWIEPFQKRYVLDMDHGMSVADTIGSYEPFWDGDVIKMRAFFASTIKAQEARTLVNEGHIRSVSVAFMTDKSKKSGEARREMLNAGLVAVPSNRDAVIEDYKSVEDDSDVKASPNAGGNNHGSGMGGDRALLQAAHDALCHLGAVCFPLVMPDADPTGASDGANKSVDEVEEKAVDMASLEAAIEEFKSNLTQILAPQAEPVTEPPAESPAEPPAVEAAAATEEVPAPAEAAEEAADDVDAQNQKLADLLLMGLFASEHS